MTQISKKWIQNAAIDHTKLDSSDSYAMRGLTVKNPLGATTFSVDASGNVMANSLVTGGDETNYGNIIIAQGSPDSTWAIEAGVSATGDFQIRQVGSTPLLYMNGPTKTVGLGWDATVGSKLTSGSLRVLTDASVLRNLTVDGDMTGNNDASIAENLFVGGQSFIYEKLGIGSTATNPNQALELNTSSGSGLGVNINNTYGGAPGNYSFIVGGSGGGGAGSNRLLIKDEGRSLDSLILDGIDANTTNLITTDATVNSTLDVIGTVNRVVSFTTLGTLTHVTSEPLGTFNTAVLNVAYTANQNLSSYPAQLVLTGFGTFTEPTFTLDRVTGKVSYFGAPSGPWAAYLTYEYYDATGDVKISSVSQDPSEYGMRLYNSTTTATVEAVAGRSLILSANQVTGNSIIQAPTIIGDVLNSTVAAYLADATTTGNLITNGQVVLDHQIDGFPHIATKKSVGNRTSTSGGGGDWIEDTANGMLEICGRGSLVDGGTIDILERYQDAFGDDRAWSGKLYVFAYFASVAPAYGLLQLYGTPGFGSLTQSIVALSTLSNVATADTGGSLCVIGADDGFTPLGHSTRIYIKNNLGTTADIMYKFEGQVF